MTRQSVAFTVSVASALLGCSVGGGRARTTSPSAAVPTRADSTAAAVTAPRRIAYGAAPSQFAELRVPPGPGPHPVVLLLHGGCWKREFGSLSALAAMADSLTANGVATWNVEYRRVGEPGAGWPGSFTDVASALALLRKVAPAQRLDLSRVVILGHSAGGTLALWLARQERGGAPRTDAEHPRARGVVSLAGVTDLEERARAPGAGACSLRAVESLLGGSPAEVPERYAAASPIRLLPLGMPQVHIWGREDVMLPVRYGEAMVDAATRMGESARLVLVDGAGHFEIAKPVGPPWPIVREAIRSLLDRPRP